MDEWNSPPVKSSEEMIGWIQSELISAFTGWKACVTTNPDGLAELERDVQQVFDRGAGQLIAGSLYCGRANLWLAGRRTKLLERLSSWRSPLQKRLYFQPAEPSRPESGTVSLLGCRQT